MQFTTPGNYLIRFGAHFFVLYVEESANVFMYKSQRMKAFLLLLIDLNIFLPRIRQENEQG